MGGAESGQQWKRVCVRNEQKRNLCDRCTLKPAMTLTDKGTMHFLYPLIISPLEKQKNMSTLTSQQMTECLKCAGNDIFSGQLPVDLSSDI